MDIDIDYLRGWIGRTQTESETLGAEKVRQFAATLDRDWTAEIGADAPLLIHLCLTQPAVPMSGLGRDGHPALGGFLPPVPLPRRMWAGGAFTFHCPIRIGETVQRTSIVQDVTHKAGRSGDLCFVTVAHEITADGRPVISERQDIVYRDATPAPAATKAPEAALDGETTVRIDATPTLLFRYSALTFNGHRIHYDRDFCTGTEGYPGLVVHGPMQATMLCHLAAEVWRAPPKRFSFRSVSPLFLTAPMMLNATADGDALKLWTARPGGPVATEARAEW